MKYTHCIRCGKSLKSEKAQEIGFGKICFEKSQNELPYKFKIGVVEDEFNDINSDGDIILVESSGIE